MNNEKAFTLVELIAVIAITVAIMSIAVVYFGRLSRKYQVESDLKEIYSTLMRERNSASTTNIPSTITFAANSITVAKDLNQNGNTSDPGEQVGNNYSGVTIQVSNSPVVFNRRGLSSVNTTMRLTGYGVGISPLDCLVVSATRINMGRWQGGICVQQ